MSVIAAFLKWTKAKRDALSADSYGDPARRLFPVTDQEDLDNAAHLIGKAKNPEAVKQRLIAIAKRLKLKLPDAWTQEAKMAVEFAADTTGRQVDGDYAVYPNSLLFVAGDFPDKSFEMSPEEMWAAVEQFTPVGGNIEHTDFLQGRACEVRSIRLDEADSSILRGEVAVPLWLDEQLADHERRLSCEWDRATKTLAGIGLVVNPRVPEAALMAAFAKAGRPRHDTPEGQQAMQQMHDMAARMGAVCKSGSAAMASAHEAKGLQAIHDLAAEHGAVCSDKASGRVGIYGYMSDPPAAAPAAPERKAKMSFWDQFRTAFGLADDWTPPAEVKEPPEVKVEAKAEPKADMSRGEDPEKAALKAELARVQAERIEERATVFAEQCIAKGQAFPAEREALKAAFCQAATDDIAFGVVRMASGATEARLDQLAKLVAARPSHQLTLETLPAEAFAVLSALKSTPKPGADGKLDRAGVDALLEQTALGRTALNGK